MKAINFILAIMFLGFSFVQLNDPDPIVWILIYGAMAAVCIMAIFDFYIPWLIGCLAAIYFLYAAYLSPAVVTWLWSADRSLLFDDLAKMRFPYIEETRECLGLVICLGVLGLCTFRYLKTKKKAA